WWRTSSNSSVCSRTSLRQPKKSLSASWLSYRARISSCSRSLLGVFMCLLLSVSTRQGPGDCGPGGADGSPGLSVGSSSIGSSSPPEGGPVVGRVVGFGSTGGGAGRALGGGCGAADGLADGGRVLSWPLVR